MPCLGWSVFIMTIVFLDCMMREVFWIHVFWGNWRHFRRCNSGKLVKMKGEGVCLGYVSWIIFSNKKGQEVVEFYL